MLTLAELRAIFKALKALLRFDATGIELFDHSLTGFWKSFWMAILVAPAYAVVTTVHLQFDGADSPDLYALAQAGAFAVSLVAFPLLMIPICRHFERRHRYIRYIVAYNWFQLAEVAFLLPLELLAEAHAIPNEAFAVLWLSSRCVLFVYEWNIARRALDVESGTAAALVVVDFLLGMVIEQGAHMLT